MLMTDIVIALADLGGIARTVQLAERGYSRGDIDRALRGGAIIRVRQGVYGIPSANPAVLTAARHGGEVACGAALKAHGVWILEDQPEPDIVDAADPDAVRRAGPQHVWVGPSGREHVHAGCRCRTHHEIGGRPVGFGIVGVLLALLQYATCGSEERFFASLESALRLGLVVEGGLAELRARLPQAKRWLIDFASDQADSGLSPCCVCACICAGSRSGRRSRFRGWGRSTSCSTGGSSSKPTARPTTTAPEAAQGPHARRDRRRPGV